MCANTTAGLRCAGRPDEATQHLGRRLGPRKGRARGPAFHLTQPGDTFADPILAEPPSDYFSTEPGCDGGLRI